MENTNVIAPDEVVSDDQSTSDTQAVDNATSNLQAAMWGELGNQPAPPVADAPPATDTPKPDPNEEVLDQKDWLKREFDVDDVAVLKAEREELRKLKEAPAPEIKFENEFSDKL